MLVVELEKEHLDLIKLQDDNYNNVILHVVWEDDVAVHRSDNTILPTLSLKEYISEAVLETYQKLLNSTNTSFINCEKDIKETDEFLLQNWLESLFYERLEQKSVLILKLLEESNNNWEAVLYSLLLKSFGSKINGPSFLSVSNALDFSILKKTSFNLQQTESLLFGITGLLSNENCVDAYFISLKKEYEYLKKKFSLSEDEVLKPEFFKLRPPNFPTIRLSQFSALYHEHQSLFAQLMNANTLEELYSVFNISASAYWDEHYTFGKQSAKSKKQLTQSFINLIIINTILPLKFCYAKYTGADVNDEILKIVSVLKSEKNSIIDSFKLHGVNAVSCKESQAILQLYNAYCSKNKCLQCAVGASLLNRNSYF